MRSNLKKFLDRQTLGKSYIVATHLWLEHVLVRMIYALLPNPDALFRSRNLTFSFLVSLCEAHLAIDDALAKSLRLFNTFRNKCAHHLTYRPDDDEFRPLLLSLREFEVNNNVNLQITDDCDYSHLCEGVAIALESRARLIGVSDIDADSVIPPDDWELQYFKEDQRP